MDDQDQRLDDRDRQFETTDNPMNVCPLCGRPKQNSAWDGYYGQTAQEVQSQMVNLEREHVSLREEMAPTLFLEINREELCPMCSEIMQGINGEQDRGELEQRISQAILKLEEVEKDLQAGKTPQPPNQN